MSLDAGSAHLGSPNTAIVAGPDGRRRRTNAQLSAGLVILGVLVFLSLAAGFLAPYNPNQINPVESLLHMGAAGHLLGTDSLGRDQLSRILYGGRITLVAGVLAGLVATGSGLILGVVAGYFGGVTDVVVARFLDVLLSFPFILLAILIVSFAGPSTSTALVAVAIGNIPFFARIIRAQVKTVAQREYIVAARATGATTLRILVRYVVLNVLVYAVQGFFLNVGWLITQTSALSFLGLGTQPPTADWGSMLAQAQEFMATDPSVALAPGLAIVVAVVGFNLVGSGLREVIERQSAGA